jgi:hypothetical protein
VILTRLTFPLALGAAFFACMALPAVSANAPTSQASSVPRPAELPFAYVHNEIVVPVYLNGTGPYNMLVDTDTTPSAIDAALAKRLHLRAIGAVGSGSGEGTESIKVYPVQASDLRVGGAHQKRLLALAVDLRELTQTLGMRIDGLLGTSFLDGRVMQIDYACRVIRFLPDAVLAPFAARFVSSDEGNVTRDVYVGKRQVASTFDTGSGSLFVTATGIARLGLQAAATAGRHVMGLGYRGITHETEGRLDKVRIGHVQLGTLPAKFNPSSSAPFDVIVGNRVLDHFVATFDYQRGLLTLTPPAACRG